MKLKQRNVNKQNTKLHAVNKDGEYLEKINQYKKRRKIKFITSFILILSITIAFILLWYFHTYKGYKVIDEKEHSASTYVNYFMLDDYRVRYTRDGISLFDDKDKAIWSATYEMQNPQIDICGKYIIVYENDANKVYLFNTKKLLYTFETTMPVKKACVSEKGTVAILVEEDDKVHRIQYMDSTGELIADGRAFFNQSGYPLDICVSHDGYNLCLSYYLVEGINTKSILTFYAFDEFGKTKVDNLVASYTYEDTVIPKITYLDNGSLVAFGDNKVLLFDSSNEPKCKKEIEATEEISSVFYDSDNFGTVIKDEGKNKIRIYDEKGKKIGDISTAFEYTYIDMQKDLLILYNSNKWEIYTKNGYMKAKATYDHEIHRMMYIGNTKYLIVGNNKIEEIKLAD